MWTGNGNRQTYLFRVESLRARRIEMQQTHGLPFDHQRSVDKRARLRVSFRPDFERRILGGGKFTGQVVA